MNPAHWHLVVNHLPIVGGLFTMLIMIYGIISKNDSIISLSYKLFVLIGVLSIVAAQTGESAEHYLKSLNAIDEAILETHVDAADFANYAAVALGIVSLMTLLVGKIRDFKVIDVKVMPIVILILSLGVAGLMGRAGNLGGDIVHKEIRNDQIPYAN